MISEIDLQEHPFTILVVDDNPVNREMWSLYLSHEGYLVETASDGRDALDLAGEKPIDLVLLDVMMPGLDGFEVLKRLREEASQDELSVVMTTSKNHSEDIVRAFDLGANDYVTKPVNLDVLLARIHAQLRGKSPVGAPADDSPEPGSTLEVSPGTVLDDRFRIESLIGKGSCGTVFSATHLTLDREVAVKLLTAAAGTTSQARLHREGISACRIEHPNAVEVLDLCFTESGTPFLVMELLKGHSVDQELKQQGSLTARRTEEILRPTCEVLAEAHSLGIIHRDVKPQNVFLHQGRRGEVVKVLDFGIAKVVGETTLSQRLTLEGNLVGTPAYMAPERLADDFYDGRADVYSLGVMLYELLAGQRPFLSPDLLELIRMHVHQPPRPLRELCPELSPEVEAVVLQALAKDPESRPTAEDLGQDFSAAVARQDAGAPKRRFRIPGPRRKASETDSSTATEEWRPPATKGSQDRRRP